jgi:hypothetical protein
MKKSKGDIKSVSLILAKIELVKQGEGVPSTNDMIKEYSEKYRESISKPVFCPYIISKI